MRLFLSAETVRRVRIILLRATHLPFVMLIWAYESSRRHATRTNAHSPPVSTSRGHVSSGDSGPSRCQDPRHAIVERQCPRPDTAQSHSDSQLDMREPDLAQPRQTELADMIDAVERLRMQVERMSATLARYQGN